jgi:cyanophycinase
MTRGSLHLVGGGWGGDGAVWRSFLAATGAERPRIAVIVVRDADGDEHAGKLVQCLRSAGRFEPRVAIAAHGGSVAAQVLDGVDGVLVGGGLTPAYLEALLPLADRLHALVDAGRPYAGFSAGSAIAAERALLGGWLQDGVPVADAEVAEDLGPLTVRDGLGLTPITVDVHAAQWGTLGRLVTAVSQVDDAGWAIDEHTTLEVDGDRLTVHGRGAATRVRRAGERVELTVHVASPESPGAGRDRAAVVG